MLVGAYLIAATPFGYLLYKLRGGKDIRQEGSGNIGASNVMRSGGKALGIATFLLDAGKGALVVGFARWYAADALLEAAAALTALVAHCYPVYLRFRGGKGIATGCGAYGVLAPIPMAMALVVFVAVLLTSRIVAIASISASLALPFLVLWWQPERVLVVSIVMAVLIVIGRHHENIRKLFGAEGRTGRRTG